MSAAESFRLSPNLSLDQAAPLRESLLSRRGTALTIDASEVERLSGPCFQVLAAARKTWDADGHPLDFAAASPAFAAGLALMGAADWTPTQEDSLP